MTSIGPTLRGAVFYALFYLSMAVVGIGMALPAAMSERAAVWTAKRFFALTFLWLRLVCGLRVSVRGPVPTGRVVIAAKHQSMLDVFLLFHALPHARFVMKRELLRAPVFGWYAQRVGAVPVDRGGGSAALRAMVDALIHRDRTGGQIVIYPQGTRVPPGDARPYKIGVHAVYDESGLPCVPVATNVGAFQPRGVAVHPGEAVVAFLPVIEPGLAREPFMARLEAEIEAASTALLPPRP
jgi:1-acyl-sn-glycerol-3-phosphate acyltransferase